VVYWLYNITEEKFLLDLAETIHEQTFLFYPESQSQTTGTKQVQAINASEFLHSTTGRGDTLQGPIDALEYTGIRFIRCGLEDGISTADYLSC